MYYLYIWYSRKSKRSYFKSWRYISNCEGGYELLKPILEKETRFLTWLPLSHSYEHAVQFIQIAVGAKVYYAESIDKLNKKYVRMFTTYYDSCTQILSKSLSKN